MLYLLITFINGEDKEKEKEKEKKEHGIVLLDFELLPGTEYLTSHVGMGTDPQIMDLVLDIGSERTWVSKDLFQSKDSSTYVKKDSGKKFKQDDFSYSGSLSTDTFTVYEKSLLNFKFILADQATSQFRGVLSLGREYDSKHYSIVYELSRVAATFYNSFVLTFTSDNKGVLRIGDIPNEIKDVDDSVKTPIHSVRLVDGNPSIKWKLTLTHVFTGEYGDDQYRDPYARESGFNIHPENKNIEEINQVAIFETIYNKIFCPKDFMSYLKKHVFVYYGSKICNYVNNGSNAYFTCTKQETQKVQKLSLVFNNKMALTIPPEKLFSCSGDTCIYLINYDKKHTEWTMGLPVMRTYQVLFDYNMPRLSFYSLDYTTKAYVRMPESPSIIGKVVVGIFLGISLLFGGAIGFIYLMKKKNTKRKLIEEQIYENF